MLIDGGRDRFLGVFDISRRGEKKRPNVCVSKFSIVRWVLLWVHCLHRSNTTTFLIIRNHWSCFLASRLLLFTIISAQRIYWRNSGDNSEISNVFFKTTFKFEIKLNCCMLSTAVLSKYCNQFTTMIMIWYDLGCMYMLIKCVFWRGSQIRNTIISFNSVLMNALIHHYLFSGWKTLQAEKATLRLSHPFTIKWNLVPVLDWDWFQFSVNQPVYFSGWLEKLVATSQCTSLCTTTTIQLLPPPSRLCKSFHQHPNTTSDLWNHQNVGRVCLCIFTSWIKVFQVWKVYRRPQWGRLIMSHRDDKRITHFRGVLPQLQKRTLPGVARYPAVQIIQQHLLLIPTFY